MGSKDLLLLSQDVAYASYSSLTNLVHTSYTIYLSKTLMSVHLHFTSSNLSRSFLFSVYNYHFLSYLTLIV